MQLFLSWSGERSKALATSLRDWVPLVLQSVNPWMSAEDLEKGARWLRELSSQLQKNSVAVLCVTPESMTAPWLVFEAGALSKSLEESCVCPLLLGLEPAEVQGPIAQFQLTRSTKEDVRRLLSTINRQCVTQASDHQINTIFELLWPKLESEFKRIVALPTQGKQSSRTGDEVLSEILDRVRSLERQLIRPPQPSRATVWGHRSFLADDEVKIVTASRLQFEGAMLELRLAELRASISNIEKELEKEGDEGSLQKADLLIRRDELRKKHEEIADNLDRINLSISRGREGS